MHIKSVHERKKCNLFDDDFYTKQADKHRLKSYIHLVHDRIKRFKCSLCFDSFQENGKLKKHLNALHE